MSELVKPMAEWSAAFVEVVGICLIIGLGLYALAFGAWRLAQRDRGEHVFREVRQRLGHGILLGLEFLVAADIIHTVAVELSLQSVGVLAAIVAIRTFLSFALDMELTGRWPWQQGPDASARTRSSP